jgi:hypothetical protein
MVRKPEKCGSYMTKDGDEDSSCISCGWSKAAHLQGPAVYGRRANTGEIDKIAGGGPDPCERYVEGESAGTLCVTCGFAAEEHMPN